MNRMFSKNSQQSSCIEEQFIIVYDKLTKRIAVSLRNRLRDNYTCAIWNKNNYYDNECRLSNKNFLILLNEELVTENLANPRLNPVDCVQGIKRIVEGNTLGLKYDSDSAPRKLSDILKESWKKYLITTLGPIILVGGVPGAIIITSWLLVSERKKIKIKLFFDAIEKLVDELLDDFLNGKLG